MNTLIVTGRRTHKLDDKGQLTDQLLTDKNGKEYVVLEFATPDTKYAPNSKGQMQAIAIPQVFIGGYAAWKESNLQSLKGNPDHGYNFQVGQEVQGHIVKRKVMPYDIQTKDGLKTVNISSVVTFADSDDKEAFEIDVEAQFKRKGRTLLTSTGKVGEQEPVGEPDDKKVVDKQTAGAK